MPPPDPIKGTRGSPDLPSPNPADEIQEHLNEAALVGDPKWSESDFRSKHLKLNLALEALHRFMRGDEKMTEEKLKKSLDAWTQSPDFSAPENKEFNDKTIKSVHAQLRKLRSSELTTRATKVKEFLPPPPPEPQPVVPPKPPTATPPPTPAPVPAKGVDTFEMDKYWNLGLSLRQDTGLLWLFDQAGIPISILASDRQNFNIRGSLDFPIEDHVGMARLHFGTSEMRGVPGATASRYGIDIGSVDPTSKGHFSTGVGLESIGPHSDVPNAPGRLFRLHFFRQSDLTWAPTENIQLGLGFFLNQQETYLPLGDEPLLPGANTPVSYASNLYARNSIPWVVLSGRYYLNGVPKFSEPDMDKPFQGGEGTTKVASILPSKIIMFNRARDTAAFATNQVFMAMEPLGPRASREQFDALSVGLLAYNILDGQIIAANADTTAEILLRGNTMHQAGALALHGADFIWHVAGALSRDPDPDPNAPAASQRGSVVDFTGRAHDMLWKENIWEGALTAGTYFLEKATSKKGKTPKKITPPHEKSTDAEKKEYERIEKENREINGDRTTYKVVGGVAAGVGLGGLLFSGLLTGRGCGTEGTLFRCTYPGTRESMFAPGHTFTPATITEIQTHSVVSTAFASLIPWGVSKVLYSAPEPKSAEESSTQAGPNIAFVVPRLELTPDKVFVGVTVQNW